MIDFYYLRRVRTDVAINNLYRQGRHRKNRKRLLDSHKAAENKYRTLLISSDPAHTLTDALIMPDLGYEPKEILPNLQALRDRPSNGNEQTIYNDPLLHSILVSCARH